jgi:hypothetical protein
MWDEHAAGYLTDELIVAGTFDPKRHVLVQRRPLRLLADVAYPGRWGPAGLVVCVPGWGVADGWRRWGATLAAARPAGRGRPPCAGLSEQDCGSRWPHPGTDRTFRKLLRVWWSVWLGAGLRRIEV